MAKYTKEFKLNVLGFYESNTVSATLMKYNISYTALAKWKRDYEGGVQMRRPNKDYTLIEKLEIVEHYRTYGITETEQKYNISNSVVYKWERILLEEGEVGLALRKRGRPTASGKTKSNVDDNEDLLKEVQRLRLENAYLKKLNTLTKERVKKSKSDT